MLKDKKKSTPQSKKLQKKSQLTQSKSSIHTSTSINRNKSNNNKLTRNQIITNKSSLLLGQKSHISSFPTKKQLFILSPPLFTNQNASIITTSITGGQINTSSQPTTATTTATTTSPITTSPITTSPITTSPITTTIKPKSIKKQALDVTESAQRRLITICESQDPPAENIFLSLKTKGCSGKQFDLQFLKPGAKISKLDEKIPVLNSNINLFVDSKALLFVIGTTMDWIEDDLTSEFTFSNKQFESCGCGTSFSRADV
jgi:iron-sulfur cluster assembly protein